MRAVSCLLALLSVSALSGLSACTDPDVTLDCQGQCEYSSGWIPSFDSSKQSIVLIATGEPSAASLQRWYAGDMSLSTARSTVGTPAKATVVASRYVNQFAPAFLAHDATFNCFLTILRGAEGASCEQWQEPVDGSTLELFEQFAEGATTVLSASAADKANSAGKTLRHVDLRARGAIPFRSVYVFQKNGEEHIIDHVAVYAGTDDSTGEHYILSKDGYGGELFMGSLSSYNFSYGDIDSIITPRH